jgi:hypothetical protein
MPTYFKTKAEQLFAEACATFLLIEANPHASLQLKRKAQARSARRWQLAYGAK